LSVLLAFYCRGAKIANETEVRHCDLTNNNSQTNHHNTRRPANQSLMPLASSVAAGA